MFAPAAYAVCFVCTCCPGAQSCPILNLHLDQQRLQLERFSFMGWDVRQIFGMRESKGSKSLHQRDLRVQISGAQIQEGLISPRSSGPYFGSLPSPAPPSHTRRAAAVGAPLGPQLIGSALPLPVAFLGPLGSPPRARQPAPALLGGLQILGLSVGSLARWGKLSADDVAKARSIWFGLGSQRRNPWLISLPRLNTANLRASYSSSRVSARFSSATLPPPPQIAGLTARTW